MEVVHLKFEVTFDLRGHTGPSEPHMTKVRREELAYPPAKKVPGDKGRRTFDYRRAGG